MIYSSNMQYSSDIINRLRIKIKLVRLSFNIQEQLIQNLILFKLHYILMNKTFRSPSLPQLRKHKRSIDLNYQKQGKQDTKKLIQIGQYIVNKQQLLGRGFSSHVYKAQHKTKGFFAAAKMIQLEQIEGKIQSRLVKNQIRNMHLLKKSQNVNKLYEVLTTSKHVVFFTELCRQSLSSKLKLNTIQNAQPIPIKEVLQIFKDILKGYFNMRKLELLHRDLKPANILLGFSGEAFLGDFGFCIKDSQVIKDKYVKIGSPLYMAPQVIQGNLYSEKADMWSIGMILLEMCVKEIPWKNAHEKDLLHIFKNLQINALIDSNFDESLKDIIKGCLIVDTAKRISLIGAIKKAFNQEESCIILNSSRKNQTLQKKYSEDDQINYENNITAESTNTQFHKLRNTSHTGSATQFTRPKNLFRLTPEKSVYDSVKRSTQQNSKKFLQTIKINEKDRELLDFKLRTRTVDPEDGLLKIDKNELFLCSLAFRIIELSISQNSNIHVQVFDIDKKFIAKLARNLMSLLQKFLKSQHKQISNIASEYLKKYRKFFEKNIPQEIIASSFTGSLLAKEMAEYITNVKDHFVLIYQQVKRSDLQQVRDIQICRFVQLFGAIMETHKLLLIQQKGRRSLARYISRQKLHQTNKTISFIQIEKLHEELKKNF